MRREDEGRDALAESAGAARIASVQIPLGIQRLQGELTLPPRARSIVLFAHGSGSGRHSPRNRFVAGVLAEADFATLLFDLLTEEEEAEDRFTGAFRFDLDLLALRLIRATDWLQGEPETAGMPVGYFGASTGAGAALMAAAQRPERVGAVVSRGGRPDLAGAALEKTAAPTLLIVGSEDRSVIRLNREAMARMGCERKLEIIPGAGHLFEEPGTLETAAILAAEWFARLDRLRDTGNQG